MKTVYVVTMWSGGRPAKKWKTEHAPELLAQGTGISFINAGTKMQVSVIGSISVEEYESGKEELEMGLNPTPGITSDFSQGKPDNCESLSDFKRSKKNIFTDEVQE
ncbi:MAG TPA: hypothetical protein PLZ53_05650 [Candidatus Hydrogenedentes bacterium]|nr:MAG: hypothetical protein BWY07_00641 [Candidatus Hydrogenedentes bacterium ADurb.Bin170]HNZ48554.1 hypothetical protein [Candidatus Hydrogenedentota bacterium]HOD95825.1 hypothetical protein [Candidatus Hydrogenedentota bacterium]HOH42580.1 hypothetical protein [Candidatus Hydrogenedentota bacterium]HOM46996.1 hypothetical protein [Candidatus Hydrogenedentota bacterium]